MTDASRKTPARLWDEFLTKQADSLWEVRQELTRATKRADEADKADQADVKRAKDDLDLLAEEVADLAMQVNAMADRIKHEGTSLPPPDLAPEAPGLPEPLGQDRNP